MKKKQAKKITKAYKKVTQMGVYIWDQFVGAAALDPKLGYYAFSYDKRFGKTGIELSPIQMPLRDDEVPYVFTDIPEITYRRLPSLLADALPDDFGNALIDRYLATLGVQKSQVTALDRLAYMGKRAMGALEFKPTRGPRTETSTALEMHTLVTEARKAVQGKFTNDKSARAALQSIIDVGTSAGGARAKAVIAWNSETREIRSGQVDVSDGFEHWLLKFDGMGVDGDLGSSQDYGRNEFAYYLMARAAGIEISESRLLEENGRAHFMTKRFDREKYAIKHHVQTLCALAHLDYKKISANAYEQLFLTNLQLALDHETQVETFRRMVFNVMSRNCDDHTKNFSYILRQGKGWALAPAYDVTFAHNPTSKWTHQHLMSVNDKFKDFELADLMAVADRFGVGEAKTVIKEVREAIGQWTTFAKAAGLKKDQAARIKKFHLLLKK